MSNRKDRRARGERGAVKLQQSTLCKPPVRVMVSCVGAQSTAGDNEGSTTAPCGESVIVPYAMFRDYPSLFDELTKAGWSLGLTGGEGQNELVHSLLCPACTGKVYAGMAPMDPKFIQPGSSKDVGDA